MNRTAIIEKPWMHIIIHLDKRIAEIFNARKVTTIELYANTYILFIKYNSN